MRAMVMGKITDLNITKKLKGKFEALLGDAHQYIVAGILIRLGFTVSLVALKGEPFDLIIFAYEKPQGREIPLRCQVRASRNSVKFTAGTRGGVDRIYKPGIKKYKYTPEHNDLIIGIDIKTLDLYLVPTRFITNWGESRAFSKLQPLKNNWDILLNWNDEYLSKLYQELDPQTRLTQS
jgi:hypothetical protein